jgi:hypothetical protein
VQSLKQLIYFATNYQTAYAQIMSESENYLFATSAINITHMLIIFFKLNPPDETIIPNSPIADPRSFKNFAWLCFLNNSTFTLLYCYCIQMLHKIWMNMSLDPKVTLM